MVKYQLENPNNCRVKIDYNKGLNPVTFEYVGTDTPFQICFKFWRQYFVLFGLIPFVFYAGSFMVFILTAPSSNHIIIYALAFLLIYYCMCIVFPALLACLFSQTRLIKVMPYLWAFAKTAYYAEFKPEDIKDNKIELPLYANVFLGYVLTEDFADKINNIEIIEHPFNKLVTKGFFKVKRKLKRQEYLWKATFYFKGKIKKGSLKIVFH